MIYFYIRYVSNIKTSNIGGDMPKNHRQLFFLYALNQGLHWFSIGLMIPVMILIYLDLGFDIGQIGIAMGIMGATVMVLELPTGGFADALGRKRIYMISCVCNICAWALVLFISTFPQLVIAVVFKGIARALSSGSMDAWFVDEHKKLGGDERLLQRDQARSGAIVTLALGLGTLAGGFLPDIFGDLRVDIIALILLFSIQIILTGVLIKEDRANFSSNITDGLRLFPRVISSAVTYGFRQRNIIILLIAAGLFGFALSGMEQLWQPRVREISPECGTWIFGLFSAGYFLFCAAGSLLSTAMLGLFRDSYKAVLLVFRLVSAVLYFSLAYVSGLSLFAAVYFIMFLSHGVNDSPGMTFFNRHVPSEHRSSLLSLHSLFFQGFGALGSVVSGQIALHADIPLAWKVGGVTLLLSAFVYPFIREKTVKENVNAD